MVEHETFVERGVTEMLIAASPSSAFFDFSLSAFGAGLQRMFLPGGQLLFRENEIADSLYIVLSGCLGVVVRGSNGHDILVARVAAAIDAGYRHAVEKLEYLEKRAVGVFATPH
jgi:CRP-like cAMP-binding protein